MQELRNFFNEMNEKHFNNIIKVNLVFYSRKSSHCGFYRIGFDYRKGQRIQQISINTFSKSMQDMKQTMLHEMIHAYLHQTGKKHGHTPVFKAMMKSLTFKVFGFIPQGNVRFHFTAPIPTKEVPTIPVPNVPFTPLPALPCPVPTLTPVNIPLRWKVLSNGKIGTFVRSTMVYGKKHIVLAIEGNLFNYTTSMDNVIPA